MRFIASNYRFQQVLQVGLVAAVIGGGALNAAEPSATLRPETQFASAALSAVETAAQVDQLLSELLSLEGARPAGVARDEDFYRRVSLDLAGVIPSAKDVTLFGLNPDSVKRTKVIDSLLTSEDFGQLWGSYWRDVVMSRATEQRARIVQPVFEGWWTDQLNDNRPWDEITRALITATGSVLETGETGLIFSHTGQPEELAAEISRIFLGIQMSCANCHDHPTDQWKREDFHQLAAFLPRISVRREDPNDQRSFAVRSFENNRGRRGGQPIDVDQIFRMMDSNRDGQLIKTEIRGPLADRFDQLLERADVDKNGKLSKAEFTQGSTPNMQQPGQGELEYYMPDLNNPAAQGALTQPVFFIPEARGPKLKPAADDQTRRHALADYLTSPTNPWFAKAFVNRVWGELLGQGFYMPVDDMGPERMATFGEVLDLLATQFVANQHDIKWLYRTIANTQAYQRELQESQTDEPLPPFASAAPTRLSSDQIYNSLNQALGVPVGMQRSFGAGRGGMMGGPGRIDPLKLQFQQTFGIDPSTPKEDIIGNVPQGLFLMNSPQVEQLIRGTGDSKLARILRSQPHDDDALSELYLLILSREPTPTELKINKEYVTQVGQRTEAFEDIMWTLINSTEFISKR